MYIITQVFAKGPSIGAQHLREDLDAAIDLAVEIVMEHDDSDEPTMNRLAIREEIQETLSYEDPQAEWAVYLGTPTTDM